MKFFANNYNTVGRRMPQSNPPLLNTTTMKFSGKTITKAFLEEQNNTFSRDRTHNTITASGLLSKFYCC